MALNTRIGRIVGSLLIAGVVVGVVTWLQLAPARAEAPVPATGGNVITTLKTATPEEGFALALRLARKGVTETQPNREVLHALRPNYAHDADSLIHASHVVAVHFQTIAAANDHWKR
jgi:hypothetical protein